MQLARQHSTNSFAQVADRCLCAALLCLLLCLAGLNFDYDSLNRIGNVINTTGTTQYTYDRSSKVSTVKYPNGSASQYRYDNAGRTRSINNTQNSGLVSSYVYQYDANGNRVSQVETNGGSAETTTYHYDSRDRLEQVEYPSNTVAYTYDDAYNRLTETVTSGSTTTNNLSYQYNDRNQLTDIDDHLVAANDAHYDYDDNGNQTAKAQNGVTQQFVFDARDDLRTVKTGGSTVGQFLYDADGLRVEKTGARGIERYRYDDQSVLMQFNDSGTLAKYTYGPERLISLQHSTEGTQFYLIDALNSVVNLTTTNGAVQARYHYDAFGTLTQQSGSSWNRFAFTGYEKDDETGLLYAKARFYDPDTARFLSQDAWEGKNELPPSLHKYLYAYQNPTVYWDPDGNQSIYVQKDENGKVTGYSYKPQDGSLGAADDTRDQTSSDRDQRNQACVASNSCSLFDLDKSDARRADRNFNSQQKTRLSKEENGNAGTHDEEIGADLKAYSNQLAQTAGISSKVLFEVADAVRPTTPEEYAAMASAAKQWVKDHPKETVGGIATAAFTAYVIKRVLKVKTVDSNVKAPDLPLLNFDNDSSKVDKLSGETVSGAAKEVQAPGKTIFVTPKGVAMDSDVLKRQGSSRLVGNFRDLEGASVDEIVSRVPMDWKLVPQDRGAGIKFIDAQGYERIRLHGPSSKAPAGSNSASGWTMRIMDRSGNYYDNTGNVVPYRANSGHIPIQGNPTAR